jgi:hypothetical protein
MLTSFQQSKVNAFNGNVKLEKIIPLYPNAFSRLYMDGITKKIFMDNM